MASRPTGRAQGLIVGLSLLARGRREGLSHLNISVQGFLASLAPWIAFALVDGFIAMLDRRAIEGVTEIAVLLCLVLLPPVLSQGLTLAWKRDARWLCYTTASTWCEWLMPLIFAAGWFIASLLVSAGLPSKVALLIFIAAVGAYWAWLHFFLARTALDISRLRAASLVLALVIGNGSIIALAYGVGGHARAMFGLG